VPPKTIPRLISASLGIALLLAGLFFNTIVASPALQTSATPAGTPDRLAKPTLPASPSQADRGAQVYWLSCLPCHGDLGQGLTDEFRQAYPPEDRNCWNSGCHGARPYDNGFKLPASIPAVVGSGTLQKFPNAAVLQAYIKAAMPFWKPGSLTDDDSWAVTAFLLRQNGLRDDRAELNASNADQARVRATGAESTPAPPPVKNPSGDWLVGLLVTTGAALLLFILWRMRHSPNPRA
jgi:cytochrome c